MPNNADHLHYYVISGGKYRRKLVDKEHFMLILLVGGKVAKNSSYNKDGIVRYEGWKTAGPKFRRKLAYKVYFPYSVIDVKHAQHLAEQKMAQMERRKQRIARKAKGKVNE